MKIEMLKQHIKPVFYIDQIADLKIQEIVRQSSDEVGWIGFVEREGNVFTLSDVVILEQKVHSATTEISPHALEEVASKLIETTGDVEKVNKLRYWGHSHVNMSPTPSGQDENMLLEIGEDSNDYFIRHIVNKKGEYTLAIYDFKNGIMYDDIKIEIILSKEASEISHQIKELTQKLDEIQEIKRSSIAEEVKGELKEKVSSIKFKPKYHTSNKWYNSFSNVTEYESSKKDEKYRDEFIDVSMYFNYDNLEELGQITNFKSAKEFIKKNAIQYKGEPSLSNDEMHELWMQACEEVEEMMGYRFY